MTFIKRNWYWVAALIFAAIFYSILFSAAPKAHAATGDTQTQYGQVFTDLGNDQYSVTIDNTITALHVVGTPQAWLCNHNNVGAGILPCVPGKTYTFTDTSKETIKGVPNHCAYLQSDEGNAFDTVPGDPGKRVCWPDVTPPPPLCITAVWYIDDGFDSTNPFGGRGQSLVDSYSKPCGDLDVPVPTDCGTSYQIDSYNNDAVTVDLIDNRVLYGPNNPTESLWNGNPAWKYVDNPACVVSTSTPTPHPTATLPINTPTPTMTVPPETPTPFDDSDTDNDDSTVPVNDTCVPGECLASTGVNFNYGLWIAVGIGAFIIGAWFMTMGRSHRRKAHRA
jgi:hypothetical protein